MAVHTVLIADDDEVFREGLQAILSEYYETILTTGTDFDQIVAAAPFPPDVVLISPERDGLTTARRLKLRWPTSRIILLALFDQYLDAALEMGADGYLLKGGKTEDLLTVINSAKAPLSRSREGGK